MQNAFYYKVLFMQILITALLYGIFHLLNHCKKPRICKKERYDFSTTTKPVLIKNFSERQAKLP